MSDLSIEPEMPEEKLKEIPIERKPEKARLDWVDAARGFIILYLIATISFPGDSSIDLTRIPILYGLVSHGPALIGFPDQVNITFTLFDMGAPAFIFLLGFSMPISYRKRKEEKGAVAARRYILFRYLLLLVLGFVIANIELQFLRYYSYPLGLKPDWTLFDGFAAIPASHRPILFIIPWDVVPSIAVAGLMGFLFMGVRNPRYRFFLGYAWAILYQFGLAFTEMRTFAEQSIHGGLFGAIFGYGAIAIIATAMGDYIFFTDVVESKKTQVLLLFGVLNLAITLFYLFRPEFINIPINRRTISISYVITAVGVSCLALWIFYQIGNKFKKKMTWLRIFGMSPFFLYFIAEVPDSLFEIITGDVLDLSPIPWWLSLGWGLLVLGYCTFIAWYLYSKNKRISTIKSSLIFMVTIIGILLIVIILELTVGIGLLSVFS